jgi:hypothetical protein
LRLESVKEIVDEFAGLKEEVAGLRNELATFKKAASDRTSLKSHERDAHPSRLLNRSTVP